MKIFAILAIVSVGLSACSSMPDFDAPRDVQDGKAGPTISQVVHKIQCEVYFSEDLDTPEIRAGLAKQHLAPFNQWIVAVTLTLTVDDTAGLPTAGTTLTYLAPLHPATSVFSSGASLLLSQERTRTFTQSYTIDIAEIVPKYATECDPSDSFNLAGNLGIRDIVYLGLHAFDKTPAASEERASVGGKQGDSFGATIKFAVTKGAAGLGPLWTLEHFKVTSGPGYSRTDTHQAQITFQPAPLPTPKIIQRKEHGLIITRRVVTSGVSKEMLRIKALTTNNASYILQGLQSLQSLKPGAF